MLRGYAAALLIGSLSLFSSCSSSENGGGSGGGTGGSEAGGPAFAQSACFACLAQACAKEQATCGSDPGCAAYLSCTKACSVDPNGYVAATCAAACPAGDTSSAQAARGALLACYESGAGQACKACGFALDGGADSGTPSILNQQCSASSAPDLCDRCLAEQCCESMSALGKPGPGKDLSTCWYDCQDPACEQECYAKYASGIPTFGGWEACLGVKCIGPGHCPTAGGPCGVCTYQNCGNELATCLVDTECYLARACAGQCTSSECVGTCRDAHPSATKPFDALTLCVQVKCSADC